MEKAKEIVLNSTVEKTTPPELFTEDEFDCSLTQEKEAPTGTSSNNAAVVIETSNLKTPDLYIAHCSKQSAGLNALSFQ